MNHIHFIEKVDDAFGGLPLVEQVLHRSNNINDKTTKYWCVAYDIMSVTDEEEERTYNINFYAAERMDEKDAEPNIHFSIGMEILRDGLRQLEAENYEITIKFPLTFYMNSVKFADVLDVVQMSVNITVENYEDCE